MSVNGPLQSPDSPPVLRRCRVRRPQSSHGAQTLRCSISHFGVCWKEEGFAEKPSSFRNERIEADLSLRVATFCALRLLASDWEIHLASRILEVADSQAKRRVQGGPRLPPRFRWTLEVDFLFPTVCRVCWKEAVLVQNTHGAQTLRCSILHFGVC